MVTGPRRILDKAAHPTHLASFRMQVAADKRTNSLTLKARTTTRPAIADTHSMLRIGILSFQGIRMCRAQLS